MGGGREVPSGSVLEVCERAAYFDGDLRGVRDFSTSPVTGKLEMS